MARIGSSGTGGASVSLPFGPYQLITITQSLTVPAYSTWIRAQTILAPNVVITLSPGAVLYII